MATNSPTKESPADLHSMIKAELEACQQRILSLIADHRTLPVSNGGGLSQTSGTPHLFPVSQLSTDTISKRQNEVKTVIESYEQRLGDDHDLGITLGQFSEAPPLRLTAVTFFSSGAVSFIGLDARGRSANLYDTLDHFSVILKKLRRLSGREPRDSVRFYRISD